jgi:hypothetical protein
MTGCWNVCTELCVAWHGPLGNMHIHIVVLVAGVSTANRTQSVSRFSRCGRHSNVSALEQLGALSMNTANRVDPTTIKNQCNLTEHFSLSLNLAATTTHDTYCVQLQNNVVDTLVHVRFGKEEFPKTVC